MIGDIKDGAAAWAKHILATGYKPIHSFLPGAGAPGTARAFQIDPTDSKSKPSIIVSADDGGFVDLLTPTDQDWKYI